MRLLALAVFVAAVGGTVSALGELPSWIRNIEASSAVEAVFFRMMSLPSGAVAFRRPPRETRSALAELIKTQPHVAELYSLRALEDEQELDFTTAPACRIGACQDSGSRVPRPLSSVQDVITASAFPLSANWSASRTFSP